MWIPINGWLQSLTKGIPLWEPLDTVMEQLGVTEELLPTAMEMGKINGTLYGVVRDFSLNTVVSNLDLKDWDYDTFFQCIQDRPELEAICNIMTRKPDFILMMGKADLILLSGY